MGLYFYCFEMAFVYLIGECGVRDIYKIGSTRKKDINDRLLQLQTGNPEELYIKDYFETDHPFVLEGMLHRKYMASNEMNEWFMLSEDAVKNFRKTCAFLQEQIDSLKHNPFFR